MEAPQLLDDGVHGTPTVGGYLARDATCWQSEDDDRSACKWSRCRDLVRGRGSRRVRTARTLCAFRIAVARLPCGGRLVHTLSTHNASRAASCGSGGKCADAYCAVVAFRPTKSSESLRSVSKKAEQNGDVALSQSF